MRSRKKMSWCFWLMILGLFPLACGRNGEDVIAEVNGSRLTLDDLYTEIPPEYFDSVTREQKQQFIDHWINAEVLYQEALRRGLQREPETRKKIRGAEKDILITDLIQQELTVRALVSEEEAYQYYQTHLEEYTRKNDEMRASQILVPTLDAANRLQQQIEDGADFAQLARQHSVDPSASLGGDLGYFARDDVLSEIAKTVFAASPGTLLKPIKTEFGYHILLLTDFQKAGSLRPFELVKDEISEQLSGEREHQELEAFIIELREASSIRQNDRFLGEAVSPMEQDSLEGRALE